MKHDLTNYKVKADRYQFLLYERGDEPEGSDPVDGEELRGFTCIGHYTTVAGLLLGLYRATLKAKTKRATTLRGFLEGAMRNEERVLRLIEDIAAKAVAARARIKATPEVPQ